MRPAHRLMLARYDGPGTIEERMRRHGEPIRYGYVRGRWPLSAYQNVYAAIAGSAEMAERGSPVQPRADHLAARARRR